MVERQCPVCNKTYRADPARLKHGRQTTCSPPCSYTLRGSAKKGTPVITSCGVCGERIERLPRQIKSKHLFCSPACAYKGRSMGLVERNVIAPYQISAETRAEQAARCRARNAQRKENGKYAQTEATKIKISAALRARARESNGAPRNRVRVNTPNRVKEPQDKKRQGWVGGCPDHVRQRISLGVARAIAEGRIPRVSALEKRVGAVLATLGIQAVPQFEFRDELGRFAAVVDFYIPDKNIALEVNGTFWHADSRFYPDGPVHDSQRRTVSRYERKKSFLSAHNIPLVEVWEFDLNVDTEAAIRAALS